MTKPILMAVDGNSLLHRAYHALANTNLHDPYGRPVWALKGMLNLLVAAADRVQPDAVVIGFDSPGDSRRKALFPDYKATRSEKPESLVTQLDLAPKFLNYAGFAVRTPAGLEADDVTATAAKVAGEHDWHAVLVTSDRDAFAHISDHTSVLRIINGGVENSPILTPERLVTMSGITGTQYLDYAALRGDTSDNLVGVRGIGEKTASKLLAGLGSMQAVWADLEAGGEKIAAVAGKAAVTKLRAEGAKEAWARNVTIMSAVLDIDLGLDLASRTGEGMVPMDAGRLATACESVAFQSGAALAAFTRRDNAAPAYDYEYAATVNEPPIYEGDEPEYVPAPELQATASGHHPASQVEVLF